MKNIGLDSKSQKIYFYNIVKNLDRNQKNFYNVKIKVYRTSVDKILNNL